MCSYWGFTETLRLVVFTVFIHHRKKQLVSGFINNLFEKSKKKFTQKDDW